MLDSYNTTDPGGVNGAMYYSTNTNTFRCYENGAWTDCLTRHVIVLGSDVVDNSGNCTYTAITGLSFAVKSGNVYRFHILANYTSAATATGSGFSMTGPASPTMYSAHSAVTNTAAADIIASTSAYDTPATCSTQSLTAANIADVSGIVKPSADGTMQADFASEVSGSAVTVKAGSVLEWW